MRSFTGPSRARKHAEMGSSIGLHAPRLDDELRALAVELGDDADLDGLEIHDLTIDDQLVVHDVRVQRGRLLGVSFAGAHLKGFELRDVVASAVDAVGARWPEASLTRVELRDCRLSGIDLAQATLRHVRCVGCRLDAANLRMIDAEHIAFDDSELEEVDFTEARLRSVTFTGSRLRRVDFSKARCERVDLRGARLDELIGVTGLRGATIGLDQLLPLAPAVFADLGITIAEG